MKKVREFFKNAFSDMKESAKAQHELDKAEFAAVKAGSKANFAEAKAMGSIEARKRAEQKKQSEQIDLANARIEAANKRIDKAKNK